MTLNQLDLFYPIGRNESDNRTVIKHNQILCIHVYTIMFIFSCLFVYINFYILFYYNNVLFLSVKRLYITEDYVMKVYL